jgi:hypothetical protein
MTKKKTILHVNQHNIKFNAKHGNLKPVVTVKQGKKNTYTNEATILDQNGKPVARIVYSPNKPLSCGARVWVEAFHEVICDSPMTFQETKQICPRS